MKRFLLLLVSSAAIGAMAQDVTSPDGRLRLQVQNDAVTTYRVTFDGHTVLEPSPIGLIANYADLATNLKLIRSSIDTVRNSYDMTRTKAAHSDYKATRLRCRFQNPDGYPIDVVFQVSDNNIAFRYELAKHPSRETGSIRVMQEKTGFRLADGTTSFVCPQSDAMIGWKRTKPSYEENYVYDAPLETRSQYGHGWTFPCLFRQSATVGSGKKARSQVYWIQISETGVDSRYCASHLSDYTDGLYTIAFPMPEENNGNGTVEPAFALPGATPWRTLTVADNLAPIAETTVMYDVVEPRYTTDKQYKFGRGTWSWIIWQDNSICYEDQIKYIDLASAMGYEYVLVDNWWDLQIGRKENPVNGHSIEDVIRYAHQKGVDVFLWYSSSGYWNDIVQGPINCMDNSIIRKREMRWMQQQGVKGIKVDFFGGDKQETMRLYEEILSDADDCGLMVIFHGCTLPRGWERMYPNYVGSEAVLASENLYFDSNFCQMEARNTATHPFIRNAVGAMEFGGCFMNRYMDRNNNRRHQRVTTDVFELATTVLFQNPIQNFALAPNNLAELNVAEGHEVGPAPQVCMDYLKSVPTTWEETQFLGGYPGKQVALARRHGKQWYIAAINAEASPWQLTIDLQQFGINPTGIKLYSGGNTPTLTTPKTKKGKFSVSIAQNDGIVLVLE
ncbi:MAG: glycoside hydrolase family 97 catalytic domain-containing protein [Bacteroidales bacterium]|nr:glycoside hydrolase family 97 catalytic domain-containing protein [Bacteroidales bacterium]